MVGLPLDGHPAPVEGHDLLDPQAGLGTYASLPCLGQQKALLPASQRDQNVKVVYLASWAITVPQYWLLLIDLTVFIKRILAFLLFIARVVSEVEPFLGTVST